MTLDTFVDLSVILTGYPESTLKPQNDTQKVAETYWVTLEAQANPLILAELNKVFLAIPDPDEAAVQKAIMDNPTISPLAQNIIRMWYTGIWYTKIYPDTPIMNEGFVISDITYKNGLVWGTMGAHPMGYSEYNFGYWETPPTS